MTAPVHLITVGSIPGPAVDGAALAIVMALGAVGVTVTARVFVDEDEASLERTLAGDGGLTVIVGSGGSAADVVRRVIARATGARLVLSDRMLAALEERFRRHDRPLPRRDERLALLPQGALVWVTADAEPSWAVDTARGAFVVVPRGDADTTRAIVEQHLVPFALARVAPRGAVVLRTLKAAGVAIGDVEERLAPWLGREGDTTITVATVDGDVWVTVRGRGPTASDATAALAPVERDVAAALGADCYGRDADTLDEVVGRLLRDRDVRLAVAESFTGGLLGHRLTSVGGSSAYFERGVIVPSNRAKIELLGVPESVLRAHGAASAPTAEAMVRGICATACTPCGLSITGIVGPDGGTPATPVGTVFIGLAFRDEVSSRRFRFLGDRASITWQSCQMALDMLRRRLGEV